MQVNARVKGPQPHYRMLLIVEPLEKFDLRSGANIGVPRSAQYLEPCMPLKFKVTRNVDVSRHAIAEGTKKVAMVFKRNDYDFLAIYFLL